MTKQNYSKNIVDSLSQMACSHGGETVFRDWCECMALSFANACDLLHGEKWQEREKAYKRIISQYTKQEVDLFVRMMADLTNLFEQDMFFDHLGNIYMQAFGGNKNLGQCFTPISLCQAMSEITVKENKGNERMTVCDPACGGGATLIAAAGVMHRDGIDYQRRVVFYGTDLDKLCVHMCYVQMCMIGANAIITHGDTLSLKVFDVFRTTPVFIFDPLTIPDTDNKQSEIIKEEAVKSECRQLSLF